MSVSNVLSRAGNLYKSSLATLILGALLLVVIVTILYVFFLPLALGAGIGEFTETIRNPYDYQSETQRIIVKVKLHLLGIFIICAITPLVAGFYENFRKVDQGEPASLDYFFVHYNSPYTRRLLTYAALLTVATSLLSLLMNFFELPILSTLFNIFISLILTFVIPIIIFENQSFEQAVGDSVERVRLNFGTVFLSGLVGGIITILGALFFGIGLIFSLPFMFATFYALYTEERGITSNNNKNL
ncbi:hypothetical protein [Capnocytophaga sputigena]|uniref:Predicted integral membrane protein n=1 Tax=Capnocytophaga sputigena TaxID=1019 RepID=A0AAX2I8J2_CAPSP|nr:hypothetical protein [Capnocytophaga sputigena]ATA85188.1 hypothetical protein CGC55_12090 [Capnocytophaga sputigena]EEB65225.1 hypothetical protein CAPSP0001_2680 [Capnocytophaga sputigena ATCC 33612]PBN46830.1 hypothetical protein CDC50_12680 [Capnocytophaga sputigena]SQA74716.1 Predicted integral membrane protein [Capnocytophaga sputigena]